LRRDHDPVRGSGIPPLGLAATALAFMVAALLLALATRVVIPALNPRVEVEPIILWFASASVVVFAPLLLIAYSLLRQEAAIAQPDLWPELWRVRLRFRPMTKTGWMWSVAALVLVGLLSGGTLAVLRLLWGDVDPHPAFMAPIDSGRYWILAAWVPFWVLNVVGEELLWRGVLLPRQEVAFGRWAWLANGVGWLFFHVSFGATIRTWFNGAGTHGSAL